MDEIPLMHFRQPDDVPAPFEVVQLENHRFLSRRVHAPRRDAFFAVLWITSGTGTYTIDFAAHEIRPYSLFFISPGQVHFWQMETAVQGFAIPFQEAFFLRSIRPSFLNELDLFEAVGGATAVYPTEAETAILNNTINQIAAENQERQTGWADALTALMQLFLIQAERCVVKNTPVAPLTTGQQLTRQFLQLIRQQGKNQHQLAAYADQLGVTSGHLTETVKQETGQPAGRLLRQQLTLEAKRRLAHSDLTAVQIAVELNFADASYFGRFFKRETGQTPRSFRDAFQKKYQNSPK